MFQPKESTTNPKARDGVVHHALAFSTLLSSQETDAFSTLTKQRGVFRLCFLTLESRVFPVKFRELRNRLEFSCSVSGATPLTYPSVRYLSNRISTTRNKHITSGPAVTEATTESISQKGDAPAGRRPARAARSLRGV